MLALQFTDLKFKYKVALLPPFIGLLQSYLCPDSVIHLVFIFNSMNIVIAMWCCHLSLWIAYTLALCYQTNSKSNHHKMNIIEKAHSR